MELFEIMIANGEPLPQPILPYYVIAKEGMFLHRQTQIGTVLVRTNQKPYTMKSIGENENGVFTWTAKTIPASIIGQATDFFRRIYEKYKTEAEVLITMHNETGEFRLFVPFQRNGGGSVKSVYEPTHIDRNYCVVGTLHSHCMMSAFHSGTDSNDASDMDGVHFTIGKVMDKIPEIVAMVAMNKKEFHYKEPKTIAEIEFNGHTAPLWWDDYVFPASAPAEKPKALQSITEKEWDEFRGIVNNYKPHTQIVPWHGQQNRAAKPTQWERNHQKQSYSRPLQESTDFNRTRKPYPNPSWGGSGQLIGIKREPTDTIINDALDLAASANILVDDDWRTINYQDIDDLKHWQQFFITRMQDVSVVLDSLGIEADFSFTAKKKMPQVKGQMLMAEFEKGLLQ